ncbi:migration and invasion-inhibitory protein isoform X3 [Anomalospiza imberbis]|uniref:migration and invasion-inhibitory protein isoform X3 n=1 Tax=Anomalospiza imberbis TaxID=187417 RepID=UPI00358F9A2A
MISQEQESTFQQLMDLELLKRLRQASQDLLQRLRMKQEEIRKGLPSKQLLPASLHGSTAAERWIPLPRRVKEARHVTFQLDPEEDAIPVSSWSACPLLGYDWIAGLLDTKSSVTEKSEQYFTELHEFRQSNRETCIHQQHVEPKALDCTGPEQELDLITDSHKCVYCYGLNQRLFTVPVDSESACPVCKIPRTHQPPGTLEEPTYVRVSIPRSALLPAYKYKAHRRRSLEPADDLALPSHCLAGWENMVPSSNALLSSLDLRASLEEKPSPCPHLDSVSRVAGEGRSDKFLHLPHLAQLRFSRANRDTRQQLSVQTPLPQPSASRLDCPGEGMGTARENN